MSQTVRHFRFSRPVDGIAPGVGRALAVDELFIASHCQFAGLARARSRASNVASFNGRLAEVAMYVMDAIAETIRII